VQSTQLTLDLPSPRTSPDGSRPKTTPSDASLPRLSELMPPSFRLEGSDGLTRVWLLDRDELPHGVSSTLSISEWPSEGAELSSLASVLETGPIPPRYFLSPKACAGILRRAEKRGKDLPESLRDALAAVAEREDGHPTPPG
jgi:hypothetical protein